MSLAAVKIASFEALRAKTDARSTASQELLPESQSGPSVLSLGIPAIDQALPDGGLPRGAVVELTSNLVRTTLTLKELMKVKAGDVLPVDIPPRVVGTVQGVPLFDAAYGALNGHYALKVERVLTSALEQAKAAS